MHGAGAVFGADVVAQQDRDVALVIERMREQHAFQLLAQRAPTHYDVLNAITLQRLFRQCLGQHQPAAGAVGLGRAFDQHVVQIRSKRNRQRRRQRPRRGGPDRQRNFDAFRQLAAKRARDRLRVARGIRHVDRGRGLVLVFDLGLGQCAAAIETPVHRLDSAQQMAVLDHPCQCAKLVGLELEIQRAIRIVPVAQHAEALEVAALHVDLLVGVVAAFLAEFNRVQLDPDLAPLLLDRDLDRQAMAVPARNVWRVETRHRLGLDDDVLEDLVDRVAKMDRAVRVRRAIVQHELRAALRHAADLRVQAVAFPARQRVRLALGQVAAHRECGVRQVQGALVAVAVFGGHAVARCGVWFRMARACASSRCICATSDGRSGNRSSSRRRATNSTVMR